MAGRSSSRRKTFRFRVGVVTGSRAEFGLLVPVLRAMSSSRRLQTRLIVTGMHLLPRFGKTIDHIRESGFTVDATVRMQTGRAAADDEAAALGRGVQGIARSLDQLGCDVVLVLGDRIEAFAAASAATVDRRVLAHIHGGDRALGDLDDQLRDAISRLAHVHLVASDDAARRLRRMGEPAARIHRVGAPGLDDIRVFRQEDRNSRGRATAWARETLGELAEQPYAVIVQHPIGRSDQTERTVMRRVLGSVARCGLGGVVLYPNSDPGHGGILAEIRRLKDKRRWRVFKSLPRADYLRLVHRSAALVGNSSSGIIESASLGINAVNLGNRQDGRLRCGPNVIDVGETEAAMLRGIRRALKQPAPRAGASVYGNGRAGERIVRVLERLIIDDSLRRKQLAY